MVGNIARFAGSGVCWGLLIAAAAGMEGVALLYQYGLDYGPCVLCIHVRIWVLGLLVVGIAGWWLRPSWPGLLACHLAALGVSLGMAERAWQVFATELGISEGTCDMSVGLPPWFALDAWLPAVFAATEMCGYTPPMPLGVSMAEALMAAALVSVLVTGVLASAWLVAGRRRVI